MSNKRMKKKFRFRKKIGTMRRRRRRRKGDDIQVHCVEIQIATRIRYSCLLESVSCGGDTTKLNFNFAWIEREREKKTCVSVQAAILEQVMILFCCCSCCCLTKERRHTWLKETAI